jgi:hypothetical protein
MYDALDDPVLKRSSPLFEARKVNLRKIRLFASQNMEWALPVLVAARGIDEAEVPRARAREWEPFFGDFPC